ncbi:probable caffeine synthase MTL2 [Coffea arabica]|uniref:Probable caffeine synthase MTL2 n=1 Tax=Coffea arabica TaxID=13443 RepID=A0ABM4X7C2_COFAR
MPGSFYGRPFPDNSMHFIHSSYSLHWLSQVPSGLVTEEGLPLNKGNIYIGKTSPKNVHDAYLDQFDRDFTNFLSARADELVFGEHLFVTLAPKIDDPVAYNVQDLLGMTMIDMVSEGRIEEKALDTFNLPHYRPSLEEVKAIIEKNRALKIRYLDTIQLRVIGAGAADCGKGYVFNTNTNAKYRARSLRATYEPIFQAHFGEGKSNQKKPAKYMKGRALPYVCERHANFERNKILDKELTMNKEHC